MVRVVGHGMTRKITEMEDRTICVPRVYPVPNFPCSTFYLPLTNF
jgi:hypothetical protein